MIPNVGTEQRVSEKLHIMQNISIKWINHRFVYYLNISNIFQCIKTQHQLRILTVNSSSLWHLPHALNNGFYVLFSLTFHTFALIWFWFDENCFVFGRLWIMETNKKKPWKPFDVGKYLNHFIIQHHKRSAHTPHIIQRPFNLSPSHFYRQYEKNITSGSLFDFINFIFHFHIIKVKFFIQFTTLWNGWRMFWKHFWSI